MVGKSQLKKAILNISVLWGILAIVLVGMVFQELISKDRFQWLFAIGFVAYSVVVTLMGRLLSDLPDEE